MSFAINRGYAAVLALYLVLSLVGCASTAGSLSPEVPAMHTVNEFGDDEPIAAIDDPWEGFNRRMYRFNYHFDKYLFLPVVSAYEFVTPIFAQKGVSNFFGNLGEVRTLYNSLFQLKGKKFLITFGRFLTNSTVGLGGLFDPATCLGLQKQGEDFGQTLGYWGTPAGPYLVLPVLGPNTLRSTGGLAVDGSIRYVAVNAIDPFGHAEHEDAIMAGASTLEAVDVRHKEAFRYYESGYPFEYYMVRFLYYQSRELSVMK
ncbi:MAG: putative phospholipid-binding lipoprotein MlaA precursor [Syntrophorhabdus sp. PtaU1.Bin153]|nr:MAG: putative phospholipid-binding lipoprotein MlaA precursor [Syntrophorhabdus sp. PtaU1.Bin153]